MRLKLVLKIVEGTVLPCNYMYELSSCLYKVLNEGNPVFIRGEKRCVSKFGRSENI